MRTAYKSSNLCYSVAYCYHCTFSILPIHVPCRKAPNHLTNALFDFAAALVQQVGMQRNLKTIANALRTFTL